METLYRQIKNLNTTDNISEFFEELHLQDGYELLKKTTTNNIQQVVLVKYCNEIYNPDSRLIEAHKDIDEIKKKVINDLGFDFEGLYQEIAQNTNEDFNNYIDWYYKQIKDIEFEAIRTGEELVAEQFHVARTRIERKTIKRQKGEKDEEITIDDDRYLRAMNLKDTCYSNAVKNIEVIDKMKAKMRKRYDDVDKLREQELLKNTGSAEAEALYIKNRNKNGNNGN